ncbi:MAG TPA: trypsin-like peptidase domain-containing protein, partial [Gemmatimonadales bacterium]|nr:trypsin-like peptidase domain-containing protein [Gemmatimonadales bacterium]
MTVRAALTVLAVLACESGMPAAQADVPQRASTVAERRETGRGLDAGRRTAIVEAAARVAPAVVSVSVVRRERQVPRSPFDFFFIPRGYDREVKGFGSGFVVSPEGIVITNQHVIEGAEQIVVTSREGRDYQARLLGEDPLTDIAVLKVDAQDLPSAPVGPSTDLMIGEWVVAIGNPYAYLLGNTEPTVTAGVVSAVDRNLLPSGE